MKNNRVWPYLPTCACNLFTRCIRSRTNDCTISQHSTNERTHTHAYAHKHCHASINGRRWVELWKNHETNESSWRDESEEEEEGNIEYSYYEMKKNYGFYLSSHGFSSISPLSVPSTALDTHTRTQVHADTLHTLARPDSIRCDASCWQWHPFNCVVQIFMKKKIVYFTSTFHGHCVSVLHRLSHQTHLSKHYWSSVWFRFQTFFPFRFSF